MQNPPASDMSTSASGGSSSSHYSGADLQILVLSCLFEDDSLRAILIIVRLCGSAPDSSTSRHLPYVPLQFAKSARQLNHDSNLMV